MKDEERSPRDVLTETAPLLAVLATRGLYDEQPDLWQLGERGRRHTLEDFGHHFAALQVLDQALFRRHVAYCASLFHARGFPQRWLDDAWRWMAIVIERELPRSTADPALAILRSVTVTAPDSKD